MTSPSAEEVYETIEEHLREHKIVTFKWLSRTLKLHNTIAKQYLTTWLEKEPDNKYIVTYAIFGKKENGELLLLLTKETSEDYFKSKSITIVDKYIYSIQLCESNFDPALIYNIDKSTYELQQMSLSSINYHTEIIRKDPKVVRETTQVNGTANRYVNDVRRSSPRKKNGELEKNNVRETSPQKKGVNSVKNDFFRRTSPRKKDSDATASKSVLNDQSNKNSDKNKPSLVKKSKTTKSMAVGGSIANFFSKDPVKKESKDEPKEPAVEQVNVETEKLEVINKKSESKKVDDVEDKKESRNLTKQGMKSSRRSNKKQSAKKKSSKRRKRILMLDTDSEEESCNSDANIDDIPEPEPEPEPVVVKEPEPEARVKVIDGKKRKRKIIEQMEEDEEGFMRTTKKVVYESCDSEDEEDEADKISNTDKGVQADVIDSDPPLKKAKTELATKKKQSSILNFLQKSQKPKT